MHKNPSENWLASSFRSSTCATSRGHLSNSWAPASIFVRHSVCVFAAEKHNCPMISSPRAVEEGPAYREEIVNRVHVNIRELQIIYVSVQLDSIRHRSPTVIEQKDNNATVSITLGDNTLDFVQKGATASRSPTPRNPACLQVPYMLDTYTYWEHANIVGLPAARMAYAPLCLCNRPS